MPKSTSTTLVGLSLVLFVLMFLVLFLVNNDGDTTKAIKKSSSSPSVQVIVEETSPSPTSGITISVIDRTSILIQSNDLTSRRGYFFMKLFRDENFTTSYAIDIRGRPIPTFVIVDQNDIKRSTGYVWSGINPPFKNNTTYWISLSESDAFAIMTTYMQPLSFTTGTFGAISTSLEADILSKIESKMIELSRQLKDIAIGAAGALALEAFLKYFFRSKSDPFIKTIFEYIIEKIKSVKVSIPEIRLFRTEYLKNISVRFRLFLDALSFTVDDFVRMGMYLPKTLEKLKTKFTTFLGEGWTTTLNTLKNIDPAAAIAAISTAMDNMAASVGKAGMALAGAFLNPIDLALLGVSITGIILDETNAGNLQDWDKFKTSDFLQLKKAMIEAQKQVFADKGVKIPAINGPLLEYSNEQLDKEISYVEDLLLFFPKYTSDLSVQQFMRIVSQNKQYLKYYNALSRTGFINTQADIDYIEQQQVMMDIRELQDAFVQTYIRFILRGDPNTTAVDTFSASYTDFIYTYAVRGTQASNKLYQIACYLFCKANGGVPLKDGQCSYANATKCFNSYPWPIYDRIWDPVTRYASPSAGCIPTGTSPTSPGVSPCVDDSDDIGKTDFIYSEWRKPSLIRADYGSSATDYTSEVGSEGGVCVVTPYGMRTSCEAVTATDEITGELTGQNYNKYTGECTNTKAYCDAFKVSYTSRMHPKDMANLGSGPLPSCYRSEVDKVMGLILGGNSLIQGLKIFGDLITRGLATMFGLDKEEKEWQIRERQRIAEQQKLRILLRDEFQTTEYSKRFGPEVLTSNTISIVDFQMDLEENIYVLYSYGEESPQLMLLKYDKFFVLQRDPSTREVLANHSATKVGSNLGRYVSSQLAISDEASTNPAFYMIEWVLNPNTDALEQFIVQRYQSNFEQVAHGQISPASLMEPGNILAGKNIEELEFNGIYIRKNILYAQYSGYDTTVDLNITGLLFYDLSQNVRFSTIIPTGTISAARKDEIFSFIYRKNPDPVGRRISFITNNSGEFTGTGNMSIDGLPIINLRSGTYAVPEYSQDHLGNPLPDCSSTDCDILSYPGMCVDKLGRLFVTNGFRIWRFYHKQAVGINPWTDEDAYLLFFFPGRSIAPSRFYEAFNFKDLGTDYEGRPIFPGVPRFGFEPGMIRPHEMCLMRTNLNGDICCIIQRNLFVNVNRGIVNKINMEDIPTVLIKDITYDELKFGIDFIEFKNPKFSNCLGYEDFDVVISPPPRIQGDPIKKCSVGMLKKSTRGGYAAYPLEANRYIFTPGTTYSFEFKINGDVIKRETKRFDPSGPGIFFQDNVQYSVTKTGGGCVTGTRINFVTKPQVYGTRILKFETVAEWDVPFASTGTGAMSTVTYTGTGELLERETSVTNFFSRTTTPAPEIGGRPPVFNRARVTIYIDGFRGTQSRTIDLTNVCKS